MSVNTRTEILRYLVFTGVPILLLSVFVSVWYFLFWYLFAAAFCSVLLFYWTGDLIRDWRNLYNLGMIAADKTASMGFPPYTGPGCVIIKMSRFAPPRMLYLIISHGNASCMYQGWNFWNKDKVPATSKVMRRSLKHRQVA
jgi:hypothetical protein